MRSRGAREVTADAMAESWEGLKREGRALESTLEARVEAFGRIDALALQAGGADEGEARRRRRALRRG